MLEMEQGVGSGKLCTHKLHIQSEPSTGGGGGVQKRRETLTKLNKSQGDMFILQECYRTWQLM